MPEYYLHGVEVQEQASGTRPIPQIPATYVGFVGTAPAAAAAVAASLATGSAVIDNALVWTAATAGEAGNGISVKLTDPGANTQALAVAVAGNAITVSLETDGTGALVSTAAEVKAAIEGAAAAAALVTVAHAAGSDGSGVVRATSVALKLSGGAEEPFPLNVPVLIDGRSKAALLGETGTLADAYDAMAYNGITSMIVVRVAEGVDDPATLANVVGDPSLGTGIWALKTCKARLGRDPRVITAPGFTSSAASAAANPAKAALMAVGAQMRAAVAAAGPNTTETDAVLERQNWDADHMYLVDPYVQVFDTAAAAHEVRPNEAYTAAMIAKTDIEKGFWWSPSNQVIQGITGTARPVGWSLSDPLTEANRMNEAGVATIIRDNGFRLWGSRGAGTDPQWAFLSVRRTAWVLYDVIEEAQKWAMARPMSAQLLIDIRESVQAFGDNLVRQGALLGFQCWVDEELNTPASMAAGKLYMGFDFEPPAPLEHLVFRAYRNGTYYEDLLTQVGEAA